MKTKTIIEEEIERLAKLPKPYGDDELRQFARKILEAVREEVEEALDDYITLDAVGAEKLVRQKFEEIIKSIKGDDKNRELN